MQPGHWPPELRDLPPVRRRREALRHPHRVHLPRRPGGDWGVLRVLRAPAAALFARRMRPVPAAAPHCALPWFAAGACALGNTHAQSPARFARPRGPQETMELVRAKGMFSFYEDGHQECCRVRKVGRSTAGGRGASAAGRTRMIAFAARSCARHLGSCAKTQAQPPFGLKALLSAASHHHHPQTNPPTRR